MDKHKQSDTRLRTSRLVSAVSSPLECFWSFTKECGNFYTNNPQIGKITESQQKTKRQDNIFPKKKIIVFCWAVCCIPLSGNCGYWCGIFGILVWKLSSVLGNVIFRFSKFSNANK